MSQHPSQLTEYRLAFTQEEYNFLAEAFDKPTYSGYYGDVERTWIEGLQKADPQTAREFLAEFERERTRLHTSLDSLPSRLQVKFFYIHKTQFQLSPIYSKIPNYSAAYYMTDERVVVEIGGIGSCDVYTRIMQAYDHIESMIELYTRLLTMAQAIVSKKRHPRRKA